MFADTSSDLYDYEDVFYFLSFKIRCNRGLEEMIHLASVDFLIFYKVEKSNQLNLYWIFVCLLSGKGLHFINEHCVPKFSEGKFISDSILLMSHKEYFPLGNETNIWILWVFLLFFSLCMKNRAEPGYRQANISSITHVFIWLCFY